MGKVLIPFLAVLLPICAAAEERMPEDAQNALSMDVLDPTSTVLRALVFGSQEVRISANIQYQRVISDHFSFLIKAGLLYQQPSPGAPQDSAAVLFFGADGWFMGFYPVVEVDWHPFNKGLKGFYLGLSGIYNYGITNRDVAEARGRSYTHETGLGLAVGWQFLFLKNLTLDLAVSLAYGYELDVDVNGASTSSFALIDSRGGIFFGFSF